MKIRISLITLLLMALPLHALAQAIAKSKDNDSDTEVTSQSLKYDDKTQTSLFSGDVVLTKGNLRLKADEMRISRDKDGFDNGVAFSSKKPIEIIQQRLDTYEIIRGYGQRAEYKGKSDTFTLSGHAKVVRYVCGQLMNQITSSVIVFNNKTNTYIADSSSQQPRGRVHSLLKPNNAVEEAQKQCAKKYHNRSMPSIFTERASQ